jgi:hypothetical protein
MATGYRPGAEVRFLEGKINLSLVHIIQSGSGVHPASYSRGLRALSPGGGVKLNTHLQPLLRSWMAELYFYSLIRLHGVVLNYLSTGRTLLLDRWYLAVNTTIKINQSNCSHWLDFIVAMWAFRLDYFYCCVLGQIPPIMTHNRLQTMKMYLWNIARGSISFSKLYFNWKYT